MKAVAVILLLGFATLWCAGAAAQVYKCVAPDGTIAFQDGPCPRRARQSLIDLPSRAPPGYAPPPAATVPSPEAAAAAPVPALPAVPPPAPLPPLYACIGAVNGNRYFTRAIPPPYLAPLGVMGYPPQSLSQAYGAPGGAGMSAPGMTKPRIGGPPIAAGMTEVQDPCLPATRAEICSFVRKEYEANHRQLRMAMRHEQPPLEQRERELQDQLRNCS